MQVFRSLDEVPADFGPAVVSVGNFDGVHLAHQQVVSHMAERAHAIGGKAVVVTFEPHPLRVLRPDVAPRLLARCRSSSSCWSKPGLMPCSSCPSPATYR